MTENTSRARMLQSPDILCGFDSQLSVSQNIGMVWGGVVGGADRCRSESVVFQGAFHQETRVDSSSSQHVTTHMPIICHDAIFGAQRANCTLNTQVPWQEWIAVSAGSYRYANNMPQITMPYLEPNYTVLCNYLGAGHRTGMDLNLLLHSSPLESSGSRTFDYWGHQGATLC